MIKKYILYIGILSVLAICFFFSWIRHQVAYEHIKKTAMIKLMYAEEIVDHPQMPEIEIADPTGQIISLPIKNQFILINLWSVKCKDCITNLNTLRRLQYVFSRSSDDWKIICVSVDTPEDLQHVSALINKYNLTELAGYYDGHKSLQKLAAPETIPVTLIVSDKGELLYKIYGKPPWLDSDIITFLQTISHAKDK